MKEDEENYLNDLEPKKPIMKNMNQNLNGKFESNSKIEGNRKHIYSVFSH